MPLPAHSESGAGKLAITQRFRISLEGRGGERVTAAAHRAISRLARQTGMMLAPGLEDDPAGATLQIVCQKPGEPVQRLGEDESYTLAVTASGARLEAPTPLGVLHGIETFLQLVRQDAEGFSVPAVTIRDQPRFPWRGLSLDVSRHFLPLEVVKRTIDGLAAVKLNVFHWHLSDDQGFRAESKLYPELHRRGSDGLYYTQAQMREVVVYARERGVRVVPEFDMPGHATSWLVGYPELGAAKGPYEIARTWGIVIPAMDPTRESVYTFLDGLIGEMAQIFPDAYFHIGGDEVNGKAWNAEPHIQRFLADHKMKDNHELQAYFNRRVQAIVKKHGKKMVGWDEILHPDLPKDIVIQSWQGVKSLAEGACQGYQGILSAGYYLDLMQPARQHYAVDPLNGEIANQDLILGGEAAMWEEFATAENVESRLWPRLAAIAERFWSPREVRDAASMYTRMETQSRRLEMLGITHRSYYPVMLARLAGSYPVEPLQVLADFLEPLKGYARARGRAYTQDIPLNRLVDALRPESDIARQFAQFAADPKANQEELRRWLLLWRDNSGRLRPAIEANFLLHELAPVSQDLADVAAVGLEALDLIASGQTPGAEWVSRRKAILDAARKPKAEVLLMVVDAVAQLLPGAK